MIPTFTVITEVSELRATLSAQNGLYKRVNVGTSGQSQPRKKRCRNFLRTFARKSSHIEICFISGLKLGYKLLIPKMEKKLGGHRPCFGEKGKGKMP